METKKQYRVNISAPNLMNICVDGNEKGELKGRLYHCYTAESVHFSNVVDLIMEVERLCDAINFPQASTKTRSFTEKETVTVTKPDKVLDQQEIIQHVGEMGTFITHIKFRQQSSWQGEYFWVEKEEVNRFTDTLDFIKQIDNHLAQ